MANNISVSVNVNSLKEECHRLAVTYSRNVAMYARDKLTEEHNKILDVYYSDTWWNPTPKRYKRTYQLKNKSFKGRYHSPHGTSSFGGIIFTPERIHYDDYDSEQVIGDYLSGWHGGKDNAEKYSEIHLRASIIPYKKLLEARNKIAKDITNGDVSNELFTQAKKEAGLTIIS